MPADSIHAVTNALRRVLDEGLPQDASVLAYLMSTHGEATAEAFAAVLEDRDSADATVLAGLLLFPGPETLERLEPILEAAKCTARDALAVAVAVEEGIGRIKAVLPGGQPVELTLLPGEARTLVLRLRMEHSPPPTLAAVLDASFPGRAAARLKVMLRHSRLDWTAPRVHFLETMLTGLAGLAPPSPEMDGDRRDASLRSETHSGGEASPPRDDGIQEILAWALSHLGSLAGEVDPVQALAARYLQLTARLRRASAFHSALAGSSFEVMAAQGARAALPHPDAVRRELVMLDSVSLAVTGMPSWSLAGCSELDLGELEDGESLVKILGGA